jgi:hypothetical protein
MQTVKDQGLLVEGSSKIQTLKMKAVCSFETTEINNPATQPSAPESSILTLWKPQISHEWRLASS